MKLQKCGNLVMQETKTNIFRKRKLSNLTEPGLKKQKTTSLLELCENEEWNIIIESAQDMIHVWDFEEITFGENNPFHVCWKGSLNVLQLLQPK